MRAAVLLPAALAALLTLSACSATVDGRPVTDRGARTSPTAAPSSLESAPMSEAPPSDPSSGSASGPTAEPSGTAAPTSATVTLPAGFYAAGAELGYRPMTTDEFDCTAAQLTGCFGFMVFSAPGCPAGASVTVGIFDKSVDPDNPLGTATGTTPPIDPDGSQAVVIGDTTGIAANLTARVQQVVC